MTTYFHRALRAMLIICGLSVATGCATDRQVISQAANVHNQLQPAVVEDPALANYLQAVGDRVIEAARQMGDGDAPDAHRKGGDNAWMFSKDMRFHFVNSKTLNAFTTGGNHMYIYTALFRQCKTEDELAAVVAHEYAHVYARHVQQGMNRQYAILGGAAAAGAAGAAIGYSQDEAKGAATYGAAGAGLGLLAGQFIGKGFTRTDEREADEYGFKFYVRAGWDPQHFADFFQRMIDLGYDTTPELASDHPTLKSRVEWTKKETARLPAAAQQYRRPPVASPSQFQQLQARAAQIAETMPSDNSLEQAQELLAAFSSCVAPVDQPEQVLVKQRALAEEQAGGK
ncbi:MAG TPA: M48 family metallopeptidase [Tepidisphaeraceae bacterium]|jgi:predicted Zn-dependent protease|nr:M48 family metallopeptidase [Tepidisphaeraceae bacterium]